MTAEVRLYKNKHIPASVGRAHVIAERTYGFSDIKIKAGAREINLVRRQRGKPRLQTRVGYFARRYGTRGMKMEKVHTDIQNIYTKEERTSEFPEKEKNKKYIQGICT